MQTIQGDFSKLYLEEYGSTAGIKIVGCTTGDAINFNTEMLEVTGPAADFVEFLPTYNSGTITSDSVLITATSGDPQLASDVILTWQYNKQQLAFIFEWVDGGTTYSIDGAAYITSASVNAPAQDFASVQLSLQITGQWNLNF